jgi:hypothetical protein
LIAIDQDLFYFIASVRREKNWIKHFTYPEVVAAILGFYFYRNSTKQTLNQPFHVPIALMQQLLAVLQA